MKCCKCGKEIDRIVTRHWDWDGSDSEIKIPLIEEQEEDNEDYNGGVYFETDANWVPYELSEEEQRECIKCPECGEFPFAEEEIQVYDVVHVHCWKK